jgi:hypothetical protein
MVGYFGNMLMIAATFFGASRLGTALDTLQFTTPNDVGQTTG